MSASIRAISCFLPANVLSNDELEKMGSGWTAAEIENKLGIVERRVVGPGECASDLAVQAAQRMFASGLCTAGDIDYLLLCTQTPDYLLPTTACLLQSRLGLGTHVGAIDVNQGCSGYIYALGLAHGLIESGQARNVLLLTADTYSRLLDPGDFSVRSLFGDAATATLLSDVPSEQRSLGPFVYGTDGQGGENLIVRALSLRERTLAESDHKPLRAEALKMDGPEIFTFAVSVVPPLVGRLLEKAGIGLADVDLFVFHQANAYILEKLRKKIGIPPEEFVIAMRHTGNTVSSTIPLALHAAMRDRRLTPGNRVLLAGFGVGYSWGAALVRWGKASPIEGETDASASR
jgi:3-oxoacyl-[acyl-carrier-protein] synthase-3